MPRYDLLAIDLDGTLLDPLGAVSEANRLALRTAREQGVRVVICTGRSLIECSAILEAIGQTDPVVVAGGSMIACPSTRSTLHRFSLGETLVARAVERLLFHRYPVMVLKDAHAAGFDYLMVRGAERHPLDPVTEWWFDRLGVRVRHIDHLDEDAHPEDTVRIGICARSHALDRIAPDLERCLGDAAVMHHFPAVVAPDHVSADGEGGTLHVLEVFDRAASKWSAIVEVARRHGVDPSRIAAIGDQVNDLPMIRGAALGIAMGNATPAVRGTAKRTTESNTADGVALAIERILSGVW